ncbi:MAG: PAS domain-containing protein, partial [Streptomyces sp.]|nr:PAS domain-containing protein [Streptomyces sp.]
MRKPQPIDYAAVFQALPGMVALLTPELVYVDVNDDFAQLAGRSREQLLGRYIFDVFPENPNDPAAAGMRETRESMLRVVATGERDTMAVLRYDIEDAQRPGHWQEHFWSPVN